MKNLLDFLATSYTAYHTTENALRFLLSNGFTALDEREEWKLREGGKYVVTRNASSFIAFTLNGGSNFKLVATHSDSCCFKLKSKPEMQGEFTRLNVEPYGHGLWYTFFDRPLKIAGRVITEENGVLRSSLYTSGETIVIPSVAVHMNREANEHFSPNLQTDTLLLYALGSAELKVNGIASDLFAAPAGEPFVHGANGEFVSAPRVDNLTSVYASLEALVKETEGICVAACFDSEEIGNRTRQGAGSDFLRRTVERIAHFKGMDGEALTRAIASSLLISLDNAHSIHPNHPEKCDPTNHTIMGGGIVIKAHAYGAYTTDALTAGALRAIFNKNGIRHQDFYNRSDATSGKTLGDVSLGQIGFPSADVGIAELAMHSAMETFAYADYVTLVNGLSAFYQSNVEIGETTVKIS